MSTTMPKQQEVSHEWYIIDAKDQTLGRMSTRIATALRGKHKTDFSPHVDNGDFVIVINAAAVNLTGRKWEQKNYYNYSGYPGGLRSLTASEVRARNPERLIEQAVKGMLPKNRLARQVIKKLKVYGGAEHPHAAQQPKAFPDFI